MIILARDKYFFNHRLKSSYIDFQIQEDSKLFSNIDNIEVEVKFLDASSSSSENASSSSSESELIFTTTAKYNETKGVFETVFQYGLRNFTLYNTLIKGMDGDYQQIIVDKENSYYKHQYVGVNNEIIATYYVFKCVGDDNTERWYIADYNYHENKKFIGSIFQSDEYIFGDSPIPPFQFKSSTENRENKPYIVWNDDTYFPEMVDMTISFQYNENEYKYTEKLSFTTEFTSSDDKNTPDYFGKEITFFQQNLTIPIEFKDELQKHIEKHIIVSLKKNEDVQSSQINDKIQIKLNKQYLETGTEELNIIKEIDKTAINNHIFKNYIIEFDRNGGDSSKVTYKLFEASESGKKNLTFSGLASENIVNSSDEEELQGNLGLSFNYFNDVDYKIQYNPQLMCWQIVSLLSGSKLLSSGDVIEENDSFNYDENVAKIALDRTKPEQIDSSSQIDSSYSVLLEDVENNIAGSDLHKGDLWNRDWTVEIPTDENVSSSSESSKVQEETSSSVVSSSSDQVWTVPEEYLKIQNNNLAFKALSDSTIEFRRVGKPSGEFHIYYAVDQTEVNQKEKDWVQYVADANNKIISLTKGQIVQFKNDYEGKKLSQDDENYYYFQTTGDLSISGNINSMSKFSTLYDDYIFYRLFYGCTISDASEAFIIIENLSPHCFDSMFEDCTSLKNPIKVFSKNLAVSCFEKMYKGCTSLIESPELSYKYLINRCYAYMFSGCTSLIEAPALPATILAPSCYEGMFSSVYNEKNELLIESGIVNPPELPATILANSCYESMFKGCTKLISAPVLPATSFILNKHEINEKTADFCYASMFEGCTSLQTPPVLNVQDELSLGCYHKMFAYSGITESPELKSTILPNSTIYKEGCYSSMFEGCTKLTITPILNAPNLTPYCYHSMFKGCENLVKIDKIQAVKLSAYSLSHMFENCTSLANEIWDEKEQKHILSITDFKFQQLSLHSCSYMFAGCSSLTKALLFSPTVMFTSCYQGLYKDCTKLTKIVYLPAKEIAYGCYSHMFEGCTSLEFLTENTQEKFILPASKLFANCYSSMFEGCTQLKYSPSLSTIRNLASNCCQRMFYNCTSLTDTPELPATLLAESCYESMFENCTSITKMPQLPATVLSPMCYKRMFYGCIKLLESTRLYATVLVEQCYMQMFENCVSLNYLDFLFKSWNDTVRATEDWVKNVASIGACRYYFSYFNDENGKPEVGDSRIPKYWYLLDYLSDKPLRITAKDNVLGVKINKNILEGGDSSKLIDYIYYNKNNSFVKKYDLNKSQTIILQPDSFVEFWSNNEEFSVSDIEYFQVKVEKLKLHENPLTFTAIENNSRLTFNYNSFYNHDKIGEFYYKLSDYEEWIRYEMGEIITLINQGDSVKFMNINPELKALSYNEYEYMYFNSTNGKFKISGNINSLINEHLLNINNYSSSSDNGILSELNVQDYGFYKLFYNMSSILDASELIINANIVGEHAYEKMFYGCTGLKSIGDIVSGSNNYHSYYEMFNNCISLRNVGDIISSIAGENAYERMFVKNYLKTVGDITTANAGVQSYYHMFYNAISINSSFDTEINKGLTVRNIEATSKVSSQAYYRMFYNYSALNAVGDIYIPTTTSEQVCQHMFESCKNLETVGSLMHGTVPSKTFLRMFNQCYSLKTIGNIECYGDILEQGTYLDIGFSNNTSLTSVGSIKAITLSNNVYENMFFGCTSLVNVGKQVKSNVESNVKIFVDSIVSTKLADYCYESMFEGCSSLKGIDLIKMGEFNNNVVYSCQDMFKNCSSLSTIKVGFNEWHENATDNWVNGVSNIGTFQVPEEFQNNNIIYGQSYIPINWTVVSVDQSSSNIEEESSNIEEEKE